MSTATLPQRPETLPQRAMRHPAVVPVGAVIIAVLIGAVIMLAAGLNPVDAYAAVITGSLQLGSLDYTFSVWGFICGMGLAAAIPLRMGEFNMGGNGQMVLGGVTAYIVAAELGLPGVLAVPLAIVAAMLVGGGFAAVSAPLSSRFGIPIIISTLLLSPVAVAIASFLVRFPLADTGSGVAQTPRLPDDAHIWALGGLRYTSVGLLLIVAIMVVFYLVDSRSAVGFEMRVAGVNRKFAAYGGLVSSRLALGSMAAAGAVAGLVGAIIVMSSPFRFIDGALVSPGYTFAGLAAALLAGGRPALVPLTAVLFTILQVGGAAMERTADVPRQLSDVVQGVVIVILALRVVLDARRSGAGKDA